MSPQSIKTQSALLIPSVRTEIPETFLTVEINFSEIEVTCLLDVPDAITILSACSDFPFRSMFKILSALLSERLFKIMSINSSTS